MSALPQLEIDSTVVSDESAVARAVAYGIDVTLLQKALSWTPTQRLRKLEQLVRTTRALQAAGEKVHGTRSHSATTDHIPG